MTLKDRSVDADEDEQLWYDRAFGPLRNIMKCKLHFNPPSSKIPDKSKYLFCVEFKYTMFPELADEFNANDYPSLMIPLTEEEDENGNPEYLAEFDRPYGTYTAMIKYKTKEAKDETDDNELKNLPDELEPYFKASHEPQPISDAE